SGVLPSPPAKLGFYRDIAVLAFRTPEGEIGTGKPSMIENIEAKSGANGEFGLSAPAKGHVAADLFVQRAGIVYLTAERNAHRRLTWEVPPADWTILRVGYTPTGVENHPAPA